MCVCVCVCVCVCLCLRVCVWMSDAKTVPFQIIRFSISMYFNCQNSSISNNQFSISTQFSSI